VDADLRRAGHGGRLLRAAEDLARERGCAGVFLETFSFQGATWYPRFGYEEIGAIDGYPDGYRYHVMKKRFPANEEKATG
jgi:GNAT superfamily N-acetyltransferase